MTEHRHVRVFHVTSTHCATDGRIFHRECRALSDAGFQVCVVARETPAGETSPIRFVRFPRDFTRRTFLAQPCRVARFLRTLSGDVYHFHDPDLLPAAGIMSGIGATTLYDCHEWYQQVFPHRGYHPIVAYCASWALSGIERIVIPRLSAVVAPTDELAAVLERRARAVLAVRNFAPVEGWVAGSAGATTRTWDLIHVGTLSRPRLAVIVDIVRTMKTRGQNVTLCLLGVSAEVEREVAKQNDLDGLIEPLARVPETDVPAYLERSRIGINYHPYQPRFMVAIPMKVFEYMRQGLPFVSSALPPLKRLLDGRRAGILVEDNDVDGFASAIQGLLGDERRAAQMGQVGRRLVVNEYNWEKESTRLVQLYSNLLLQKEWAECVG